MHYRNFLKSGDITAIARSPSTLVDCGSYLEVIICDRFEVEVARAKIDHESRTLVCGSRWSFHTGRYARGKVNGKAILMHRLIAGFAGHVDHINRDGLDNRRSNLRPASYSENAMNRDINIRNAVGYKGVRKNKEKYEARLGLNGKRCSLGHFNSALEAAIAYDKAALNLHGEFAATNFLGDRPLLLISTLADRP